MYIYLNVVLIGLKRAGENAFFIVCFRANSHPNGAARAPPWEGEGAKAQKTILSRRLSVGGGFPAAFSTSFAAGRFEV